MKKLLLTILFVFTVTFSYSQNHGQPTWLGVQDIYLLDAGVSNIEAGYEIGVTHDSISRYALNFSVLTNNSEYFAIGVGTGFRYYPKQDMTLLPVYGELRGYTRVFSRKWVQYLSIKLGYSFNLSDNFDGVGLLASPSIGIIHENKFKQFYNISINYSNQTIIQPNPPNSNYGAIGIMAGFTF